MMHFKLGTQNQQPRLKILVLGFIKMPKTRSPGAGEGVLRGKFLKAKGQCDTRFLVSVVVTLLCLGKPTVIYECISLNGGLRQVQL